MQEDGRASDDGQRVERVLQGQVDEPEEAASGHALDRAVGHPSEREKPVECFMKRIDARLLC